MAGASGSDEWMTRENDRERQSDYERTENKKEDENDEEAQECKYALEWSEGSGGGGGME